MRISKNNQRIERTSMPSMEIQITLEKPGFNIGDEVKATIVLVKKNFPELASLATIEMVWLQHYKAPLLKEKRTVFHRERYGAIEEERTILEVKFKLNQ